MTVEVLGSRRNLETKKAYDDFCLKFIELHYSR